MQKLSLFILGKVKKFQDRLGFFLPTTGSLEIEVESSLDFLSKREDFTRYSD